MVFRPHVERTIIYYGHDGESTLRELELSYGLLLGTVRVSIEGIADLRASTKGIFSLRNIISELLHLVILLMKGLLFL